MKQYFRKLQLFVIRPLFLACSDEPKSTLPGIDPKRDEDGSVAGRGQTPGAAGSGGDAGAAGAGPSSEYCAPQNEWPGNRVAFEAQLPERVNKYEAKLANNECSVRERGERWSS